MSGVIDDVGQWEHCNGCGKLRLFAYHSELSGRIPKAGELRTVYWSGKAIGEACAGSRQCASAVILYHAQHGG